MVSMWPWKGDDNSPASFEKTLSVLSDKISTRSIRLDRLRQRSRRFTVLWTLYSGFAYLLCAIILVLVVGWRKWGPVEYTGIAAGPLIIYFVRFSLTSYYEYRISRAQGHVDDLQQQRDSTIKKLKAATKYDTTAELLKKYGGTPTPKAKSIEGSDRKVTPKQGTPSGRTSFAPPPTANIPVNIGQSPRQGTPQRSPPEIPQQQHSSNVQSTSPQQRLSPPDLTAEFAPNAFSSLPQYAPAYDGPRWYDRFMDVLLGEDESLPGKRLALICSKCRLVNGQAPPGIKRLEDVGVWRCGGCGTMNGRDNDVSNLIESIEKDTAAKGRPTPKAVPELSDPEEETKEKSTSSPNGEEDDSDVTVYSENESEAGAAVKRNKNNVESPRRSTRSTKGKKSS